MKLVFQILLFFVWLSSLILVEALTAAGSAAAAAASEEEAQDDEFIACDYFMQKFCRRESQRGCYMDENNKPKCGKCLRGLIDFQARCVPKDMIELLGFLDEFAPEYVLPTSLEERYELLDNAVAFITDFLWNNPDAKYFQLGLTPYSADTVEDMKSHTGIILPTANEISNYITFPPIQSSSDKGLPKRVDWVERGAVTDVKSQGRCNSCWAFVAAGAIEGAVAIKNGGFLQSLSAQQFVSCDTRNSACNGGNLNRAFSYAQESMGIARYLDYPYTDRNGKSTTKCLLDKKPVIVQVESVKSVVRFFEHMSFFERKQRMKTALAKQPVGVVMKSTCALMNNYVSGIVTDDMDCACSEASCIDHGVLLVGYDDTSNPPYWKIKNQWGTRWGEGGYMRISQEEKGDWGLFGILADGDIPDVAYNLTAELYQEIPDDSSCIRVQHQWWVWVVSLATFILGAFVWPV